MTVQEIMPSIDALSHTERLALLQLLVQSLIKEET